MTGSYEAQLRGLLHGASRGVSAALEPRSMHDRLCATRTGLGRIGTGASGREGN